MRDLELPHRREHVLVVQILVGACRNVEAGTHQSHLRILDAELEQRPVGDNDDIGLFGGFGLLAAARLDQELAQRFELRAVGLEAAQISGRVRAKGERAQHL